MSMSLNGSVPWRVTTRIISSGVTPLAHSAAMNDPAEVPDVDVELVDRAVHRQQVERPQRADLVHAPGEPAAAEHERGLVLRLGRRRRSTRSRAARTPRGGDRRAGVSTPAALARRFQLDNLAHADTFYGRACPGNRLLRRPRSLLAGSCARRLRRCAPAARAPRGERRRQPGRTAGRPRPPARARRIRRDGAYVYDLTAKQALFSERATTLRPPASVEKLYTATTALERMGASARLSTTVLGVGHLGPGRGVGRQPLPARRRRPDVRPQRRSSDAHYGGIGA